VQIASLRQFSRSALSCSQFRRARLRQNNSASGPRTVRIGIAKAASSVAAALVMAAGFVMKMGLAAQTLTGVIGMMQFV
jgi:hypothetical protein